MAQTTLNVWVDNATPAQDPESQERSFAAGNADCNFDPAQGSPGTAPNRRLSRVVTSSSSSVEGLEWVLRCIRTSPGFDSQNINVYVVCRNGAKDAEGRCAYTARAGQLSFQFGHAPSSSRPAASAARVLRAEPEGMVHLRLVEPITVYDRWTVEGLRFDGQGTIFDSQQSTTWVNLAGSNVTFARNWVGNMRGSCIRAGLNTFDNIPNNITIANNRVEGCYSVPLTPVDRHCIFTYHADNLRVLYNEMTRCQGDGFQTFNHAQPLQPPTDPNQRRNDFNTVATNTHVIGNRIWTSCKDYVGPDGVTRGYTLGENAIDIKRTGLGLRIQENLIWGYRPSGATTCPSYTETTSYLNGSSIVLHGTVENDSGALVSGTQVQLNPQCSLAERDSAQGCALVEGNDISDSSVGLSIGSNKNIGPPPRGVIVRGNVIHDLRGADGLNKEGQPIRPGDRGAGMKLTQSGATQDVPNLVYRNTLVNVPGESIFLTGNYDPAFCGQFPAGSDERYFCESDSRAFNLQNNLVAWTGPETSSISGQSCRAPLGSQVGGVTRGITYFHRAHNLASDSDSADPGFFQAYTGAQPNIDAPNSCGALLPALPAGFHDVTYGTQAYDYRLSRAATATSSAVDHPSFNTDPLFRKRDSDTSGTCGTGPDLGADEKCDTQLIYMEEHPSTADRAQEVFTETSGASPWGSGDISVWQVDATRPTRGLTEAQVTGTLPYDEPTWDVGSEILVRVRTERTTLTSRSTLQVRVYQGRPHTSFIFPKDFNVLVDRATVTWGATSGTGWRLAGRSLDGKISVYAFPWTPKNFYRRREHSCLRVELSTDQDPRPPLFTHITRSNNLAQRNLHINAQAEQVAALSLVLAPNPGLAEQGQTTENRRLQVFFSGMPGRTAYIYFPRTEAERWEDNGTQAFPPPGARVLINNDDIIFTQALPTDRNTFAQVLVDSRNAGPPVSGEHVWVKDGHGMVQTYLVGPGFRESFEWGIRPGWEATGLWRAVDRHSGTCGGSRLGRRAAAFNHASSCGYEGFSAGTLTSPSFTVNCATNPQSLYFWHWSQTERSADYDRRRVNLSINGGAFFTVWQSGADDTGGPDTWRQQRIGLEDFCSQQVRVQFAFDSVDDVLNSSAGWYLDDLEVR